MDRGTHIFSSKADVIQDEQGFTAATYRPSDTEVDEGCKAKSRSQAGSAVADVGAGRSRV